MLLLLMLRCPNPVRSNELIEWVWPHPDFEPDYASSGVAQLISRLRSKLGEFRILTRKGFGYRLVQEPKQIGVKERNNEGN